MKKVIISLAIALSCTLASNANAQNVLGNLLNQAVSSASNSSVNEATGGLLGNLLASVTGSTTTTSSNLVGNWSYTKPSVQFESENLLTQAGGITIANKVVEKLEKAYKLAGIKQGKLTFNFQQNGKLTYGVGSIKREGTYTFNDSDKTIAITTSTGATIKAYVTVSGNQMALTFEAKKMLALMNTISSKFQSLKTVESLINQYTGAKVGFEFERK